uniref:Uncharacterized protein n=1 Tax=Arundo donax TaxID=35708 RepID=A0A0A9CNX8_ARUDO
MSVGFGRMVYHTLTEMTAFMHHISTYVFQDPWLLCGDVNILNVLFVDSSFRLCSEIYYHLNLVSRGMT